jgi:hypothetical protein
MDWVSVQVPAAIIAGIVSLVGGVITAAVTLRVARQRATVDEKLATLKGTIDADAATRRAAVDLKLAEFKGELDHGLAEQKAQLDQRTLFQAERVAHELLTDPRWTTRSFRQLRHYLGGFEDNKLREVLVRAGAIRFGPDQGVLYDAEGDANTEMWGLLERNRNRLGS